MRTGREKLRKRRWLLSAVALVGAQCWGAACSGEGDEPASCECQTNECHCANWWALVDHCGLIGTLLECPRGGEEPGCVCGLDPRTAPCDALLTCLGFPPDAGPDAAGDAAADAT
jgi:hypothetical protein